MLSLLIAQMRHHNISYSGCEVIATFNVYKALGGWGSPEQMAGLISAYESHGAALFGEFGTSPRAIERYFRQNGFTVTAAYGEKFNEVDRIGGTYQVMIATVYNDKNDITKRYIRYASPGIEKAAMYCIMHI